MTIVQLTLTDAGLTQRLKEFITVCVCESFAREMDIFAKGSLRSCVPGLPPVSVNDRYINSFSKER